MLTSTAYSIGERIPVATGEPLIRARTEVDSITTTKIKNAMPDRETNEDPMLQVHSPARISSTPLKAVALRHHVHLLAKAVFKTEGAISEWLALPTPALGGKKTIDDLETEGGIWDIQVLLVGMASAKRGTLESDESELVCRLTRLHARAIEVLERPENVALWFCEPNSTLGGFTPLALSAYAEKSRYRSAQARDNHALNFSPSMFRLSFPRGFLRKK
jgi:uncharacterized protein (DUF2384 family)